MSKPLCSIAYTRLGSFIALLFLALFVTQASVWGQSPVSAPNQTSGDGQSAVTLKQNATLNQAASTSGASTPSGLIHIVPFGRGSGIRNTTAPAGAHLNYFGGPVLSKIHVVAVFWGPNVDGAITAGIGQFFTDITSSNYYDLLTEYSTLGVTGSGGVSSNQAIARGTFDAQATITPSIPCPTTCTITDAQIQTELTAQITAGHLPQPVTDAQGTIVTFYMIYFPPGVTIQADPVNTSCVQFCAYHSNTPGLIPYGVLPDFGPTSACSVGCGTGTLFQNVTAVTSHEMSEAVTDAQVGSATTFAAPLAWYDHNPPAADLGEIADICNAQDVQVIAGGNTYSVQQDFSNLQNDCVSAPPVFHMTGPASVSPGVATNVTLTVQSSVSGVALTAYTGTVHFTSSDPAAVLPADYTFVAADAGSHQFPVTLATIAPQTITVTDIHASGFNGTVSIDVNALPDLTITKTHVGNFVAGQTGTYTITVSNIGNGPTFAAVTVTDSLPAGLTAASLSGAGWTCSVGTVSCTRADALAKASSYPAISLVVNAGGIAPASVTNTVTVAGGGETNTANDSATDPTTISGPDVNVAIAPGIFFQGATGATYTIFPGNVGDLPTSGTITVQDTMPAGLTATSIAGVGWTCTLATLTCTRADSIPASTAMPVILIMLDVALNAPSPVTNVVTISGGSETNTANDTAQDVSTVGPPRVPDLTVAISHVGATFIQGQSATYTVQVNNIGFGTTTSPFSVITNLPPSLTATSLSGAGWTCTLATVTCTNSTSLSGPLFAGTITLQVAIAANAPASVTLTSVVSGGGDTNTANNTASDVTPITTAVFDLQNSLTTTSGTFAQGQNNGSYVVVISNQGNVPSTGVVTVTNSLGAGYTAPAIAGTGWTCVQATLTCARADSLAPSASFPAITVSFNVAPDAPASAVASIVLSGGGDATPANNTSTFTAQITPAIAIGLGGPGTATVTAGTAASYNLALTLAPTAGTVTFACAGLPKGAACSFNPPSLTASGTAVLSISTTSRATGIPIGSRYPFTRPPMTIFLLVLVGTLATLMLAKRTPQRRLAFVGSSILVIAMMIGCGGHSTPSPGPTPTPAPTATPTPVPTPTPNPNGTPAGAYVVTVTASGTTAPATQTITLVVN